MPLLKVSLEVDQRELHQILAALDELPGKVSRELHNNLTAQVNAQIAAHNQSEAQAAAAANRAMIEQAVALALEAAGGSAASTDVQG